jgi:hypothetical protein
MLLESEKFAAHPLPPKNAYAKEQLYIYNWSERPR